MKVSMELTQEKLKQILHYNPDTGIFTRLTPGYRYKKQPTGSVWGLPNNLGYIRGRIFGSAKFAHRLAFLYMEGEMPKDCVDHIDRDPSNNKWENLRHATQAINLKNQKKYDCNKSGITGVRWDTLRPGWVTTIGINGVNTKLGMTQDFFEACCKRKSAEIKYGYSRTHGC